jgi:molybdate transport system substrate-binding protein
MAVITILSAGAAQAVVEKIAAGYTRDTGNDVKAEFSAVGAMKQRVIAGEPVDVILLTSALVDELAASHHVAPGSRADLGKVGTGVAVRAGAPQPDVSSEPALRGNLLAARRVVCPDPAVATAGKVVMRTLEKLEIAAQVQPRMQFFPNGYAAMKWLADSWGALELGITQITEILANPGVTYVGPLPGTLQMKTTYSAGVAARATNAPAAKEFIRRLTSVSARPILAKAGYEFENINPYPPAIHDLQAPT